MPHKHSVTGWLEQADDYRKQKATNKKAHPDATPATPTQERLIAYADKHGDAIKKGHKKKHDAAKELDELGFQVEVVE